MIHPQRAGPSLLADLEAQASTHPEAMHLWWLGQSGFLLQHQGSRLLLDPYLSDALTLKYAATDKPHVRLTERVIEPSELRVKVVTSSHQHTDHFDEATLLPLAKANAGITLVLPQATIPAARRRLGDSPLINLVGSDDGHCIEIDGWSLTGIAAAHNDIARDEHGHCYYLGFIIRRAGFTLYHSGDTLWHPGLVPGLLPARCDVALVPINGHDPSRRVAGNLNGTEAAALAKAIAASLAVPHHFEMFEFNTASPEEFTTTCKRLAQPFALMKAGGRLSWQPNQGHWRLGGPIGAADHP